jgi:hypothetical protein
MIRNSFLKQMDNVSNHRLLLWYALTATKGKVVEYGSGEGSTQYLRKYCKDAKREFETYDYDANYAKLNNSEHITNWDSINPKGGVILIDHSPGERRHVDIKRLKDNFDIMVIHDSEPVGGGDYKLEPLWSMFKYRVDVKSKGAWATAVSNTIDLKGFKGKKFGKYTIS